MSSALELIEVHRLVAIIRLADLSHAAELSAAMLLGGIVLQEFTLTNPDALKAIAQVRKEVTGFATGRALVGVGSIRNAEQVRAALDAGAQFVVTPTLNPEVIRVCREANIPVASGAFTPTEILKAWELGSALVKVFPVRGLGPKFIEDVLSPLPELKLMPTGGVDLANMNSYFDAGAVAVGIGGNLVDKRAVCARDWDAIASTARLYTQKVSEYNLARV